MSANVCDELVLGHVPNLICHLAAYFLFYITLLCCNASNCLRSALFVTQGERERERDGEQEEGEKQMLPQEEG